MNQDEIFKIIGILIVSFFIIHIVVKMFHLQTSVIEGLTNNETSTTTTNASGEAGTAASYAAAIKAQVVKLQDELLVAKYRKDYEAVIINLDDYIGYSMLKLSLNFKMKDDIKENISTIEKLNALKNAKQSLNETMAFLDKQ
jgi:hypothetical protein